MQSTESPRIAITGGIAEGKSTVLGYLRSEGHLTISSDDIAREHFFSDEVQEGFARILSVSPPVSPSDLRGAILSSLDVRRQVNRLMHPIVMNAVLQSHASFFEVPLLLEACLYRSFDEVWVVTCGEEEQIRRLTMRVGSEDVSGLIAVQLKTRVKVPFADRLIRTNDSEGTVKRVVVELARETLANSVAHNDR